MKMKKAKPLSWKPVRKGKYYCAPACGRACTHAEYLKARHAARDLCKLLGPAWRPRVWENLGWHYQVGLLNMTVAPSGSGYWASYEVGSNQFEGRDADPRKAVVRAYLKGQTLIDKVVASNKALLDATSSRWGLPAPSRRLRG
jgi:hypothetical protein